MNRWYMFLLFKLVMIGLLLYIQFYCYRKISGYLQQSNKSKSLQIITIIPFILFNLPLLVFLFWIPKIIVASTWLIYVCIYPFYLWHFSFFIVCLLLLVVNLLKLPFVAIVWSVRKLSDRRTNPKRQARVRSAEYDSRRRIFMQQGVTILTGAALTGSAYGAFRKDAYELTNTTIQILNLPPLFEGFSIALISDIHSSVFMAKEKMMEYAHAVNALRADLILVTGDFVNSQVDEVYPFAEAFVALKAPDGVYGVLGNHDYYTGNVDAVARNIEECGIRLLVNDHVALRKEGEHIYLLGSDDVGNSSRANDAFHKALAGVEKNSVTILMCHRPYYFQNAASRNIDSTLSGHTHGGQIVFGKINDHYLAAARIASPYIAGLYSIGTSKMYVSRGIGTVGVPIRINCPPEITRITLTKA